MGGSWLRNCTVLDGLYANSVQLLTGITPIFSHFCDETSTIKRLFQRPLLRQPAPYGLKTQVQQVLLGPAEPGGDAAQEGAAHLRVAKKKFFKISPVYETDAAVNPKLYKRYKKRAAG